MAVGRKRFRVGFGSDWPDGGEPPPAADGVGFFWRPKRDDTRPTMQKGAATRGLANHSFHTYYSTYSYFKLVP